jgi:ferritin
MLQKKILELLNSQINKEFFSAYFYLDMANYYSLHNLNGFANWFRVQAQEERDHAMMIIGYVQNNGDAVLLRDVKSSNVKFEHFGHPLTATLAHERGVTKSIHDLYAAAQEEKDFRTAQFLDWFVREQGEEEKSAEELVGRYELFGKDGKGLFLLDGELAARTYTPQVNPQA